MTEETPAKANMEKIVSLSRRRGFIFPSSDIYGGLSSCWDYGPLGVELKKNVKEAWWQAMVRERDDMVGMDTSILMHPKVWEASGHIESFTDPLVECKSCHQRFRPDKVPVGKPEDSSRYFTAIDLDELIHKMSIAGFPSGSGDLESKTFQDFLGNEDSLPCPFCDVVGQFTEPRQFHMMFKTFMGPVEDDAAVVYLRPETAQGIFVNFQNVLNTTRKRLPFGIAQMGKVFRNEITTGNFIFRSREFEQMEIEYFVKPGTDEQWFEYWLEESLNWYVKLGIKKEHLRLREHDKEELSHYSRRTVDINYLFPMGWDELQGIANRGDFDLTQHAKASGKDLSYFDDETKEHIVPYVIEPSAGVDRAVLAFLCDAYDEEPDKDDIRVVLRFHPSLAPYKAAILPLSRREPLVNMSKDIHSELRKHLMVAFDDAQSVGRRYRRQDEIGTPFCVTVDFQSLEDNQVTIRERDSMDQIRVPVAELEKTLIAKLAGEDFSVLPPGGSLVEKK
ncbi:MAG: glycine--tRNA ligase [Dehalococcoidales bacterium]